jgi:hypothetical protein
VPKVLTAHTDRPRHSTSGRRTARGLTPSKAVPRGSSGPRVATTIGCGARRGPTGCALVAHPACARRRMSWRPRAYSVKRASAKCARLLAVYRRHATGCAAGHGEAAGQPAQLLEEGAFRRPQRASLCDPAAPTSLFRALCKCADSKTYVGTKEAIERFIDEVVAGLGDVRAAGADTEEFVNDIRASLGVPALCLSGGASLGNFHWGVVKAFVDAGTLPRIISGTSAGAVSVAGLLAARPRDGRQVVAATVCTRTDEELRETITPKLCERLNSFQARSAAAPAGALVLKTPALAQDHPFWVKWQRLFTQGRGCA